MTDESAPRTRLPLPDQTQRIVVVALWLGWVVLLCLGMPAAPTDWDPQLFVYGVERFDMASHHPHPPGYPVLIWLARGVRLMAHDPHRSLCLVSLLASSLLPVFLYRLLRSGGGFTRAAAAAACAVLSLSPVYWLHAADAVSEPLGTSLLVGGAWAAWQARGRAGSRAAPGWWVLSAVLCGLAIGARPQLAGSVAAMLIACLVIARARAGTWAMVVGTGAAVCAGWLGWMMWRQGGWTPFWQIIRGQGQWLMQNDAMGGGEYTLHQRVWHWGRCWGSAAIAWPILALALVGLAALVRARRAFGVVLLAWVVPYVAVVWLTHNPTTPRYVIPALPVLAAGCVAGLRLVGGRWAVPVAAGVCVALGAQGAAVVRMYAAEPTPLLQAMQWCRAQAPPAGVGVIYEADAAAFVEGHLAGVPAVPLEVALGDPRPYAGWYFIRAQADPDTRPLFSKAWTAARQRRRMFTRRRYQSAYVYSFSSIQSEANGG